MYQALPRSCICDICSITEIPAIQALSHYLPVSRRILQERPILIPNRCWSLRSSRAMMRHPRTSREEWFQRSKMSSLAFERGSEWVFHLNWLFPYTVSADMVDISVYNPISRQQAKDSKLALKRGRKCQYLDRKLLIIRWKHKRRSVCNIFHIFDRNIWLTLTKGGKKCERKYFWWFKLFLFNTRLFIRHLDKILQLIYNDKTMIYAWQWHTEAVNNWNKINWERENRERKMKSERQRR